MLRLLEAAVSVAVSNYHGLKNDWLSLLWMVACQQTEVFPPCGPLAAVLSHCGCDCRPRWWDESCDVSEAGVALDQVLT